MRRAIRKFDRVVIHQRAGICDTSARDRSILLVENPDVLFRPTFRERPLLHAGDVVMPVGLLGHVYANPRGIGGPVTSLSPLLAVTLAVRKFLDH